MNSCNSVLRCYLGMVLSSLKQPLLAVESFDQAAQAEPQNGMACALGSWHPYHITYDLMCFKEKCKKKHVICNIYNYYIYIYICIWLACDMHPA